MSNVFVGHFVGYSGEFLLGPAPRPKTAKNRRRTAARVRARELRRQARVAPFVSSFSEAETAFMESLTQGIWSEILKEDLRRQTVAASVASAPAERPRAPVLAGEPGPALRAGIVTWTEPPELVLARIRTLSGELPIEEVDWSEWARSEGK